MLWFADVCATMLGSGGDDVLPAGSGFPLAVNLHASFVGNQKDGELRATSVFVKRGRRLSVVRQAGKDGRISFARTPRAASARRIGTLARSM